MDTRKVATEYRMAQWSQTIQARVQSGQSIKDFCATTGISRNRYFYWQRKLRQATCSDLVERESDAEKGLVPSGWVRLESKETASTEEVAVTVEISGCRVSVTTETDPELLARICRTLKAL